MSLTFIVIFCQIKGELLTCFFIPTCGPHFVTKYRHSYFVALLYHVFIHFVDAKLLHLRVTDQLLNNPVWLQGAA